MSSFISKHALTHPSEDTSRPRGATETASNKGLREDWPCRGAGCPSAQIRSKAAPAWHSQWGAEGGPEGGETLGREARSGTLAAGVAGHPTSSYPTVMRMGHSGTETKDIRSDVSIWTAPWAAAGEPAGGTKGLRQSARRPVSAGVDAGAGGSPAAGPGGRCHCAGARPSSVWVRRYDRAQQTVFTQYLLAESK